MTLNPLAAISSRCGSLSYAASSINGVPDGISISEGIESTAGPIKSTSATFAASVAFPIGTPVRSTTTSSFMPLPHFVGPMAAPLFAPPRRWRRRTSRRGPVCQLHSAPEQLLPRHHQMHRSPSTLCAAASRSREMGSPESSPPLPSDIHCGGRIQCPRSKLGRR